MLAASNGVIGIWRIQAPFVSPRWLVLYIYMVVLVLVELTCVGMRARSTSIIDPFLVVLKYP